VLDAGFSAWAKLRGMVAQGLAQVCV